MSGKKATCLNVPHKEYSSSKTSFSVSSLILCRTEVCNSFRDISNIMDFFFCRTGFATPSGRFKHYGLFCRTFCRTGFVTRPGRFKHYGRGCTNPVQQRNPECLNSLFLQAHPDTECRRWDAWNFSPQKDHKSSTFRIYSPPQAQPEETTPQLPLLSASLCHSYLHCQ